jgi:hypothetical protein
MISTLDQFSLENPRLVGYNDLDIGSRHKTLRPIFAGKSLKNAKIGWR